MSKLFLSLSLSFSLTWDSFLVIMEGNRIAKLVNLNNMSSCVGFEQPRIEQHIISIRQQKMTQNISHTVHIEASLDAAPAQSYTIDMKIICVHIDWLSPNSMKVSQNFGTGARKNQVYWEGTPTWSKHLARPNGLETALSQLGCPKTHAWSSARR